MSPSHPTGSAYASAESVTKTRETKYCHRRKQQPCTPRCVHRLPEKLGVSRAVVVGNVKDGRSSGRKGLGVAGQGAGCAFSRVCLQNV